MINMMIISSENLNGSLDPLMLTLNNTANAVVKDRARVQ